MDQRHAAVKDGLSQLTTEQIERLLNKIESNPTAIVCDTYWHNPQTKQWCPKSIGMGLDTMGIMCHTNSEAKKIIEEIGKRDSLAGENFNLNTTSGIEGDFYTTNRLEDLKTVCLEIIYERQHPV